MPSTQGHVYSAPLHSTLPPLETLDTPYGHGTYPPSAHRIHYVETTYRVSFQPTATICFSWWPRATWPDVLIVLLYVASGLQIFGYVQQTP